MEFYIKSKDGQLLIDPHSTYFEHNEEGWIRLDNNLSNHRKLSLLIGLMSEEHRIKGLLKCKKCGTEAHDKWKYCALCGTSFPLGK